MSSRTAQSGFTLVELMIVLAISSLVVGAMAGIIASEVQIPLKIQSEAAATHQLQNLTLLLTEDANTAQSFTAGTSTTYGTFKWYEFSGASPVEVTARYFWQNETLTRELTRGGEISPAQIVFEPVPSSADVAFTYTAPAWTYNEVPKTWTYTEGFVTVSATSTRESAPGLADNVINVNIKSDFRPQIDRPVPLPGRLAPPTPPANQVNFYVSGNPTILQGTYKSGTGANLQFDDTLYYETRGTGSPRTIIWEATSEAIDYATITSVSVEFTGRVDKAGISQSFFVYDPNDPEHTQGGYSPSPDESSTYPTSNTDRTILFQLSDADVTYVNSLGTKVIRVKMVATDPNAFDHQADKLVFKVAGTPNPTFFRDYVADTDPSIETGNYSSGSFSSLATDDTSYYAVNSSSNIVQWTAVSEAINLDTLSSVEIRFTGRSTQANTSLSFYVFNPANGGDGYPATPNATSTYVTSNTDVLTTFFLSPADVDYAESVFPKEVRIRVKATRSGAFRLDADQLVFRSKP